MVVDSRLDLLEAFWYLFVSYLKSFMSFLTHRSKCPVKEFKKGKKKASSNLSTRRKVNSFNEEIGLAFVTVVLNVGELHDASVADLRS